VIEVWEKTPNLQNHHREAQKGARKKEEAQSKDQMK